MIILHYFLGFPPYRSGGLTKFATDIMCTQSENGNQIYALWPGKISAKTDKIRIKRHGFYKSVNNYELINPLPIPLDEGVISPKEYMHKTDITEFYEFLKKIRPDIIHIHTLMGLYKEMLECANKLNIKIVFTTHDYYGISLKPVYIYDWEIRNDDESLRLVAANSENGLSHKKIKLMQSPAYRLFKNSFLVKLLRKRHRTNFFIHEQSIKCKEIPQELIKQYRDLKNYYKDMLKLVDAFHYNSSITKKVYSEYLGFENGTIITITHKDIHDNRKIHVCSDSIIRFAYLAKPSVSKGYIFIKKILDKLWDNERKDFCLNIFYPVNNQSEYMSINEDGYKYEELGKIMANTDVVLVPSIWYETFGYTALESLSYGIPVIISDHVGAKDIVKEGNGLILEASNEDEWFKELSILTKEDIEAWSRRICENSTIKKWNVFDNEIINFYRSQIDN